MAREAGKDIEIGESSITPEIDDQDDEEYAETVEPQELQRKAEGWCSIVKIPRSLKKIHHKGYEPEIVSIGPYHNGKEHLQRLEEHKHRYLNLFLDEVSHTADKKVLERKILQMETAIRNSYSEELVVMQPELLEMMLLDGCFILMLFLFIGGKVIEDENSVLDDDPILTTPWILSTIRRDLLLLENQVPLILLKSLLEAWTGDSVFPKPTLEKLALNFFNLSISEQTVSLEAEHLLDLIRKNFISGTSPKRTSLSSDYDSRLILSAKRLRLQGIKFKASNNENVPGSSSREEMILKISLSGNELYIPPIVFDGFISSVLLNCVAFEQLSSNCSNNITSYVVFMGCLMNDEADAIYLSEKGIIENYFGNGSEVSQFFKLICKDVAFDMSKSYLKEEFEGINKYTSSRWNVECARFKHLHFDSPWTLLSSLAVLAAILLSVLQTIFGGLSYLHHCK